MNVIRKRVLFTGHVQGVGFRYTAHNIATKYDVRGFVRNLPDGKVETIVEGPGDQVRSVIADLSDRMEQFIQRVDAHDAPVSVGEFHEFSIRHG